MFEYGPELDLPGSDDCGDEITGNEKIYYMLVSDDGFGRGPSYGAVHAFKLHGNGGTNSVVSR